MTNPITAQQVDALYALIGQYIIDNTAGTITPAHVRLVLGGMVEDARLSKSRLDGLTTNQVRGSMFRVPYVVLENGQPTVPTALIPVQFRILGMEAQATNGTDAASVTAGVKAAPMVFRLLAYSAGPVNALLDEQATTTATVKARWVRLSGTDAEKIASFPVLVLKDRDYAAGDVVQYTFSGGETRLLEWKRDATEFQHPLPTGLDSDANYKAFAPLTSSHTSNTDVVHKVGDEVIAGCKTFSNPIFVANGITAIGVTTDFRGNPAPLIGGGEATYYKGGNHIFNSNGPSIAFDTSGGGVFTGDVTTKSHFIGNGSELTNLPNAPLYTTTGQNTDGSMNQKSVTDILKPLQQALAIGSNVGNGNQASVSVGGFRVNVTGLESASVGGGAIAISGNDSGSVGGSQMTISGSNSGSVGGGGLSRIAGDHSAQIGGYTNSVSGNYSAIVAGAGLKLPVGADYSAIIAGHNFSAPVLVETAFLPQAYLFKPGGGVSLLSPDGTKRKTVALDDDGSLTLDGVKVGADAGAGPSIATPPPAGYTGLVGPITLNGSYFGIFNPAFALPSQHYDNNANTSFFDGAYRASYAEYRANGTEFRLLPVFCQRIDIFAHSRPAGTGMDYEVRLASDNSLVASGAFRQDGTSKPAGGVSRDKPEVSFYLPARAVYYLTIKANVAAGQVYTFFDTHKFY